MVDNSFKKLLARVRGQSKKRPTAIVLGAFFLIIAVWRLYFSPPIDFPSGNSAGGVKLFSVYQGETLRSIADDLKNQRYIRSAATFKIIVRFVLSGEKKIIADDYFFEKPLNSFALAKRIVGGETSISPIRVTIFEGLNKFEIADVLSARLPNFDAVEFIEKAPEGYLFPDTYFFSPKSTANMVIETMKNNFEEKIATLKDEIAIFDRPLDEIIKVASILETEARQLATRKTIADIIWRRLELNMPLQVDVSFKYVNGKNTYDLTSDDLAIDSPYNTYLYPGLPPTPIANPGLDAIMAAIQPTKNSYLFFLSDKSGRMYYAKTFEEHKENKIKYLHVF